MYLNFYNLAKQPFHITPDPQFLYLSESHKQALASMIDGIDGRKGLIAITGGVGVGKTTIVRAYLQKARKDDLKVIYVFHVNVTFRDLVRTICRELELDLAADDLVDRGLGLALTDLYRSGKNVVIVIDEAQSMPVETLESLRMWSNLETAAEKLVQVVLVGQPELDELLEKQELRQLKQSIAVRSAISPLTPPESLAYIEHRLSVAGLRGAPIFEKKAIDIIIKEADGVPRMLNILCDNALIAGFGYQKNPVTASIAKEVASDFASPKPPHVREERAGALMSSKKEKGSHVDHRPAAAGPAPILRTLSRLTGRVFRFFNVIWDGVFSGGPIRGREGVEKEEPVTAGIELSDGLNYARGEARMAGDLIGNLSEVRLFDLVKPLVDGKKSGMVIIGRTEVRELYVEGGSIVHGRSGALVGEEAITTMMDLDEGRVVFNWQLSPEKRTVRMLTEELMANWTHREEEWKKTREVAASSGAVFSIVVDSGGKDRTILEKQWGVLALCDGARSASEVAVILGRNVDDVVQTIGDMVGMGVLEKAGAAGPVAAREPKKKTVVGDEFFAAVETELKKVVGPVARVIMNDTLAAFDESRGAFPEDRVQAFIQTVSEQIVEEQKRDAFERAIQLSLRVNY